MPPGWKIRAAPFVLRVQSIRCLRLAGREGGLMSESLATADAGVARGRSGSVISRNPNASVALGSGAGVGSLIVWSVGLTGTQMPPEVGAAFGGLVAAAVLFIGRRGLRGTLLSFWRGEEG